MHDLYEATVATGALRLESEGTVRFPHRWTPEGVTVQSAFTGAHLLHLAIAGCVLNDLYREAAAVGVGLHGVRVSAAGGFDTDTWTSTGLSYSVELRSDEGEIAHRLRRTGQVPVEEAGELPVARIGLRAGRRGPGTPCTVRRCARRPWPFLADVRASRQAPVD
jgi:hypothetical protein